MRESDDELAVLVARTGNREAFGELARRHQAAVRSTLTRLTRNSAVADDLAQETFIRAYLRISQYVTGQSFRAWLGGIAYREFLQDLRRQKTSQRHLDQISREHPVEFPGASPELIDLDRALESLRIEERTAVVLCHACGMSHSEISKAMGAPLGTVKSWVNRGRSKLEEALEVRGNSKIDESKT